MKSRSILVSIINLGSIIVLFLSCILLAWIYLGHHYRPTFAEQFKTFHDGVNLFEAPEGFPENRDENLDKFDHKLYESVRSIDEAIVYLKENYPLNNEKDALFAVFDFTSKRFIHHMYPIHTWKTNPFYVLFEMYDPLNSFNEMSTANELLRHSAIAGCGDTSVTAITLFRKLGYQAQYVSLNGHHVAEFKVGETKWLVDADMEVISPHSIDHIRNNLDLIHEIYAKYPESRQNTMKKIFARKGMRKNGYEGAPRYGDYMWNLHKQVEILKWIIPITGIIFSLLAILLTRKRPFHNQYFQRALVKLRSSS